MADRVFVLGIDGGTFDIILPLIEKGKLPHLAGLLAGGVWGDLESTIHPITPAAWASFATGQNPGKHGIFDFSSPHSEQYGFKLNSARDRKGESFWMRSSHSGKKVIVINIPFTYPPEKVNGIMISGFDAPGTNRSMAHPPEIYDELAAEFGSYTPDWTFPVGKKYDLKKYRGEVVSAIQRRAETSLYLLKKYPWDLFITIFNSIDHIQHVFFGMGEEGMKIIEEGYELMDRALGTFLQELGKETTILIMSDHGAGKIEKFIYLDQWLEREGYQTIRKIPGFKKAARTISRKGYYLLKRLLPVRIRGYLRGRLPAARDFIVSHAMGAEIDWSMTKAYSGGMYGNIFINRKGREQNGIVSDQEYKTLCQDIIDRLAQLEDPETGEKVVEIVYRKEELYKGPLLSRAPDLIIKWKDYAYFTKKGIDKKGTIFGDELKLDSSDYPHTGTHRLNGILIAKGPDIEPRKSLKGAQIMDLAPTILFLLGLPIPNDMDGKVILEMFNRDFLEKNSPRYFKHGDGETATDDVKMLTPEEEEEYAKRLKSLGYID